MIRHLIILPDGTEIFSGSDGNAIASVSLTEQVNVNKELTLGSCFSSVLEAKLITPKGNLNIAAGSEIQLYRVDDAGNRTADGIFVVDQPTRPSANTLRLSAYDRIIKLDEDLTEWLSNLNGWPYSLLSFAKMVCQACGVTLTNTSIPNGSYLVQKFTQNQVTGRQLLRWCAELACRFVRATPTGDIEFAWYKETSAELTVDGDSYYLAKSLTYENYSTAPIDAVQMQMADGSGTALLPKVEEGANSYAITKNPLLSGNFDTDIQPVLSVIQDQLKGVTYTPMKVSCPASRGIRAGDIITVTDRNGVKMTTYVMSMTRKGTKETLECTGSQRRDDPTAQTASPTTGAINKALNNQSQAEIFNKLTNNGELQGLYIQDGKLYINAEFVQIVNLVAEKLLSTLGLSQLLLDGAQLTMTSDGKTTAQLSNQAEGLPIFYMYDRQNGIEIHRSELTPHHIRLGGSDPSGIFYLSVLGGSPSLALGQEDPKTLSWKSNGDGTYSLIGR